MDSGIKVFSEGIFNAKFDKHEDKEKENRIENDCEKQEENEIVEIEVENLEEFGKNEDEVGDNKKEVEKDAECGECDKSANCDESDKGDEVDEIDEVDEDDEGADAFIVKFKSNHAESFVRFMLRDIRQSRFNFQPIGVYFFLLVLVKRICRAMLCKQINEASRYFLIVTFIFCLI